MGASGRVPVWTALAASARARQLPLDPSSQITAHNSVPPSTQRPTDAKNAVGRGRAKLTTKAREGNLPRPVFKGGQSSSPPASTQHSRERQTSHV
uniref:Putative secreted protein n=1 Tax=Ixodes ricinus TaxID=34613 RepID=A0A6B0UHL7_IXORI